MSHKKKLLIFFPFLGKGGIERQLIYLLQYLSRDKFVPVVVFGQERADDYWNLPPDVKVINLAKQQSFNYFWRVLFPYRVYRLSAIIKQEQPDVILSFMVNANLQASVADLLVKPSIPLLWLECINLSSSMQHDVWLPRVKKVLVRLLHPKVEAILCVSKGVKQDLVTHFQIPQDKCEVIYNPIDIDQVRLLSREPIDHPWFHQEIPILLGCGRLEPYKNFPLLLKAAQLVAQERPVRVVILGEGSNRNDLENLARRLGIESFVAFLGFQENPYKFMAQAAAFVLSSSWEGFPYVLLEAMAAAAPVISTLCPDGPEELITDEENGLLVPVDDEQALARAILRVLNDASLRDKLSAGGRTRVEDFRIGKIIREYEEILEKCSA